MLYGYSGQDEDGPFIVITAAPSTADFTALPTRLEEHGIEHHVAHGIDFLTNDRVRGMAHGIIIDGAISELASIIGITLVHRNRAIEQQREMASRDEADMFDPKVESRSIKEIFGLDKNDPWAPPPKPEDEAKKKKAKDKKIGDTTGDSFGGPKDDKVARVTDTRVTVDSKDRVTAVDVLAVKGLHDKDEDATPEGEAEVGFKPSAILITSQQDFTSSGFGLIIDPLGIREELEYGPGWVTTKNPVVATQLMISLKMRGFDVEAKLIGDGFTFDPAFAKAVGRPPFAMFFRLDIKDIALIDAVQALEEGGVNLDSLLGRGEDEEGCWIGVSVERLANDYSDLIKMRHILAETEVYAVNLSGIRMAPKGTNVLDPNATPIYGPRPWSDPVAWALLSDEDREAEMKAITGQEFLFTGSHTPGKGTTLIVTPKSYFDIHQEPWTGDIDPYVAHLLVPQRLAFVKQDNFTYLSRSIDFPTVVFVLAKQGMIDSMKFRMWMNLA